jgi:chromate transport protein ChrA
MLASLLAGLATGETMAAIDRARRAAIAYGLAALLAALGLFFLLIAAFIWAARRFGPIEAAAGFGAAFIVLALIIVLIHKVSAGARRRTAARRRSRDVTRLAATAGFAALPVLFRNKASLALAAIGIVGYAIYRENFPYQRSDDDL